MTTTTWTTTADIPPGPWAAMGADIRRLLAVTAAGGAKVVGPNGGNSQPLLNEDTIAFVVTAPASQPLAVTFHRAAGTGEVTTNAPHTDGLVLTAMDRAGRHWGRLFVWDTDAGTTSRAVAARVVDGLFGEGDRALAGTAGMAVSSQVGQIIARAAATVDGRATEADLDLTEHLDAVIEQLIQERDGLTVAGSVLQPPPPPGATT